MESTTTSRVNLPHELTCGKCGKPFDYIPSMMMLPRNHPAEFYQGTTYCPRCAGDVYNDMEDAEWTQMN